MNDIHGQTPSGPPSMSFTPAAAASSQAATQTPKAAKAKAVAQPVLQKTPQKHHEELSLDHHVLPGSGENVTRASSAALGLKPNPSLHDLLKEWNTPDELLDGVESLRAQHDENPDAIEKQVEQLYEKLLEPTTTPEDLQKGIVFFEHWHEDYPYLAATSTWKLSNALIKKLEDPSIPTSNARQSLEFFMTQGNSFRGLTKNLALLVQRKINGLPSHRVEELTKLIPILRQNQEHYLVNTLTTQLHEILLTDISPDELQKGIRLFSTLDYLNEHQFSILENRLYQKLCDPSVTHNERQEGIAFFTERHGEHHSYVTGLIDTPFVSNTLQEGNIETRKVLASTHWGEHPERLAHQLFQLFTPEQINADRSFFDPLIKKSLEFDKTDKNYLEHHKLYLDHCKKQETSSEPVPKNPNEGHHWECLGNASEDPGCLVFKLRWKHDPGMHGASRVPEEELSPDENFKLSAAVEPILHTLTNGLNDFSSKHLERLGFRYENSNNGVYLILPEPHILNERWKVLQSESRLADPPVELPDFVCANSAGIATSEEFLGILQKHDVVVAFGTERVHDMMIHTAPSYRCAVENPAAYVATRDQLREIGAIAVRAKEKISYPPDSQEHATAQLLLEMVAILHDVTTAQESSAARAYEIQDWNDGNYSNVIGLAWMPILRQRDDMREYLDRLGITSTFPREKFMAMWENFKAV